MASAPYKLPIDTAPFTRNDWILAGRRITGLACATCLFWTIVFAIPLRSMPPEDRLTWFDSTIVQATDRYWRIGGRSPRTEHVVKFTVTNPDGFKRYLELRKCTFGNIVADDLRGKRARVGMWGETLVALSIDGHRCIQLADSRTTRERELDQRAHMLPRFALWSLLAGFLCFALMRLKLDPPTARTR